MDTFSQDTYSANYQFLPFQETIQKRIEKQASSNPIQKRIDKILEHLQKSGNFSRNYQITVFKSPAMQVLHAQEGKIFIADSLVKLASNNDELAFIIAHEIAHWENGDMINNLVKIPISTGQATDAECLADARAKDIVNKSGYIAKRVQNLLDRLKRKALRSNDSCDME